MEKLDIWQEIAQSDEEDNKATTKETETSRETEVFKETISEEINSEPMSELLLPTMKHLQMKMDYGETELEKRK